ncbi:DNA-binding transcriptional regulator, AcrR family [Gillisia sp. Hel1_33_143]|uniref:TetR/AcrR family transcriptional regulator n=1 Tax=Gillisia sp. Hel1_33_143 TaxID=1336796 RepID=UPI00087C853B|nr:TetR/AcrR family transcriptional regulator [Gillisia sp. Hel1_33_143]SDS10254.1 DNA-binding transcriptional regulator, AcrR family [Gillisia sp. Hel1_33_143]
MARKKEYIEEEVIEKAMNLFWRNGYETTSMHMLEKEMGINKFSIYSSFGSKNGVFLESLKCYKQKLNLILLKLKDAPSGVAGIKQYFYDFIEFTRETEFGKGCLVTNTANEIGTDADENIKQVLTDFMDEVKQLFLNTLKVEENENTSVIEQQADFLTIAMFGLSSATRIFTNKQLENYIENVFKDL